MEICSQPVDVALLDVMMPGRTGFLGVPRSQSEARTCLVPVVLVTGLGSAEDRIQGIEWARTIS